MVNKGQQPEPRNTSAIPFANNAYAMEVSKAFMDFLYEEMEGNFCPETRLFERIERARVKFAKDYERLRVE